jgi:Domain of unknown function (DUF4907)
VFAAAFTQFLCFASVLLCANTNQNILTMKQSTTLSLALVCVFAIAYAGKHAGAYKLPSTHYASYKTNCYQQNNLTNTQPFDMLYQYNDSLQYSTYAVANGWGYSIYYRYKLLVTQPNIPAIAGSKPFYTEADAKKIAHLATTKVAKGQMPPTLSVQEIAGLITINK